MEPTCNKIRIATNKIGVKLDTASNLDVVGLTEDVLRFSNLIFLICVKCLFRISEIDDPWTLDQIWPKKVCFPQDSHLKCLRILHFFANFLCTAHNFECSLLANCLYQGNLSTGCDTNSNLTGAYFFQIITT